MKIKIAAFLAGIIGVLGVLLFLVAFGTDYWLLATETCGGFIPENSTYHTEEVGTGNWTKGILTFHHEGFFWRCWFFGEDYKETIWNFWFTSQAHPKHCMHGYLFPMPIALGPHPHPSYDATAVYRGFWTAFIVLAVTASLVGGFLLVCGVPFVSARFYKVGGGFLITAAVKEDAVNISLLKKIIKFLTQRFHNFLLGPLDFIVINGKSLVFFSD
ncbi:transmembrane protein 182 isoform X2 [Zootoca vivipara]|uniref:transmembrane protein 182 isoform X2 n=1 Tax=Zootoca vivipara TaxID=8524 RepID=UPI001592A771|nr:transmembrane protein 182 isoform X2 [Zootoca vivipara]